MIACLKPLEGSFLWTCKINRLIILSANIIGGSWSVSRSYWMGTWARSDTLIQYRNTRRLIIHVAFIGVQWARCNLVIIPRNWRVFWWSPTFRLAVDPYLSPCKACIKAGSRSMAENGLFLHRLALKPPQLTPMTNWETFITSLMPGCKYVLYQLQPACNYATVYLSLTSAVRTRRFGHWCFRHINSCTMYGIAPRVVQYDWIEIPFWCRALLPPRGQHAGMPNEASLAVSFPIWEVTCFVYSSAIQFNSFCVLYRFARWLSELTHSWKAWSYWFLGDYTFNQLIFLMHEFDANVPGGKHAV